MRVSKFRELRWMSQTNQRPCAPRTTCWPAYEDELKAILAEVQAAEAKCRALVAEHDTWQIAQEQRDRVLEEAARLRDELDGLDFHGRRSLLLRIRAKIKAFTERDANPRWCVTTEFAVGRYISLSINKPVDLGMIAVGGSSGHMKSGTVPVCCSWPSARRPPAPLR